MFLNIIKIILLLIAKTIQEEKILFAFQINSNGGRSPNSGIKNEVDLFKEKWPGNNELSKMGRRQLYLLGVKTRKKYINKLLPEYYNPNNIYIKSTDDNHTIESVYSFLQGLFPSGHGQNIPELNINKDNITYPPNIKYKENFEEILREYNLENNTKALPYGISIQPIHIFYKPKHDFQLNKEDICPGLNENYKKINERKKIKEFVDKLNENEDIKDMFMKLENSQNIDFLYNYKNLYSYIDSFRCDNLDMRNFDKLKNEIIKDKNYEEILSKLNKSSYEFLSEDYLLKYNSTEIFTIDTSQTFRDIIYWMEQSKNKYKENNINYIKYVLYSSDESSIGTLDGFLYSLLNESKMEYSNFPESRYIELYSQNDEELRVRYLKSNDEVISDMTYNDFKEKIENKIWNKEKIDNFCKFEKENENNNENGKRKEINKLGASIMIILSILDGFLIALLILVCVQQNLKNKKIKTQVIE